MLTAFFLHSKTDIKMALKFFLAYMASLYFQLALAKVVLNAAAHNS